MLYTLKSTGKVKVDSLTHRQGDRQREQKQYTADMSFDMRA